MTLKPSLRCGVAVTCLALLAAGSTAAEQLPSPGVGVFITAGQTAALREKILRPPCQALYQAILKEADASLARWPADRERLHQIAPKLLDLTMEAVPAAYAPEGGKEASRLLEQYAVRGAPNAAFVYLMTGDRRYADFAWDVFTACAKTGRWGWFPWDGSHMPQIHYGTISRNMVLVADCTSDALTPAQRQQAREVIAEKVVEPYFRIVLHTPGMGLYHLRSLNQGNNALGAAVAGSAFVGDAVPDNRLWQRSLVQTLHWAITHDIGWMGQHLESGIGGYWSISVQNLYTAAAALANDRPFKQAFAEPKWFSRYARTFEGMLDPGLTVPFGDGWKEVAFDAMKDAAYVRVTITKYWGIGGGLNEVQVYGK